MLKLLKLPAFEIKVQFWLLDSQIAHFWCRKIYLGVSQFLKQNIFLIDYRIYWFVGEFRSRAHQAVADQVRGQHGGLLCRDCSPHRQAQVEILFRVFDSQKGMKPSYLGVFNFKGWKGIFWWLKNLKFYGYSSKWLASLFLKSGGKLYKDILLVLNFWIYVVKHVYMGYLMFLEYKCFFTCDHRYQQITIS